MSRYFVILACAGLVACDSDSDGTESTQSPMTIGCVWKSFDATVRSGPNQGASLKGRLVLALMDGTDDFYGTLFGDDASYTAVSGHRSANTLSLTFETPLGLVEGDGPIANLGAFCKEGLTGELSGPTDGDGGDWIGEELVSYDATAPSDSSPSGLGPDGTVDFQNSSTNTSPACTQSRAQNGDLKVTCRGGGAACTTTYPAGGGAATSKCKVGYLRPGLEVE